METDGLLDNFMDQDFSAYRTVDANGRISERRSNSSTDEEMLDIETDPQTEFAEQSDTTDKSHGESEKIYIWIVASCPVLTGKSCLHRPVMGK